MIIVSFVAKLDLWRFDELNKESVSGNFKVTKSTDACFVVREEFVGKYVAFSSKVLDECSRRFCAFAAEVGSGDVEFGVQFSGYKEIESGSGFLLTPLFLNTISKYSPWIDIDFYDTPFV